MNLVYLLLILENTLFEDLNESMSEDEEEYDPEVQQYDEKAMPKNGRNVGA